MCINLVKAGLSEYGERTAVVSLDIRIGTTPC